MSKQKRKLYDFGSDVAQTYKNECSCGNRIEVSTQRDCGPEYQTEIYVKCQCGGSVEFILPVN